MATKDPKKIKAAQARYYQANKARYRAANELKKSQMRAWLTEVKSVPCMDCGLRYPYYVMDLDHREGEEKLANPSDLVNCLSWKKMKAEVAKCDVVCSNCHRERTYQRASSSTD